MIDSSHPCRDSGNVRRGGSLRVLVLAALAVLVILAGGAWYYVFGRDSGEEEIPLTAVAEVNPYEYQVVEQGEVESSENVEVKCEVKGFNGSTAILWVIPEGTQVAKGVLLVQLDASALEQQRLQQEILCNTSKALVIQAQNTYEAALIAREEYLNGTYKQEEQLIQSEIFQAEENLRRAEIASRSGLRLADRGIVKPLQIEADKFTVDKARLELESTQTRLRVLQEYTKPKMLKTLDSDIATAKAQWESEEQSYEIEDTKLKDIKDQIAKCEIRSPAAGQVVHANEVSSRGNAEFIVEAGAMVREQQAIIRLPNPTKMQVKAKINESQITSIRAGMPVKIRIDAFSDDQKLDGVVTKVNEYPEPSSWFSSPVKQYGTLIKITSPPKNIRPGLTAEVSIQVERRPQALQVPVQAIYDHFGTTFCFQWNKGDWQAREVTIGSANEKFAVIESGLSPDDVVVMNPRRWVEKVSLPAPPEAEFSPDEQIAEGEGGESSDGPSATSPGDAPGQFAGAGGPPGAGGPTGPGGPPGAGGP
ncbi:MAG: HlyD family efflux transporter periplasmic adaptor subunit, partial [Planctomycetes bacterium]|nr:HlyD family efflux transporter periplasmic adaptor subunit [Planctomycetota bacterium]